MRIGWSCRKVAYFNFLRRNPGSVFGLGVTVFPSNMTISLSRQGRVRHYRVVAGTGFGVVILKTHDVGRDGEGGEGQLLIHLPSLKFLSDAKYARGENRGTNNYCNEILRCFR